METILHNAWSLFVAIGWFFLNRITSKVDALEKEKASVSSVKQNSALIHEGDKRIDQLQYTTVPRQGYKYDVASLHLRLNDMERAKQDKFHNVKVFTKNDSKDG